MILEAIKTLREKDDSFLVFEIKRLKPTRPGMSCGFTKSCERRVKLIQLMFKTASGHTFG